MIQSTTSYAPGPLERTVIELTTLSQVALFRRHRKTRAEQQLARTDALLAAVEDCNEGRVHTVPAFVWSEVVTLVREIDGELRQELGHDRQPHHVSNVLFLAQEQLMQQRVYEHLPRLAPIIPLPSGRRG